MDLHAENAMSGLKYIFACSLKSHPMYSAAYEVSRGGGDLTTSVSRARELLNRARRTHNLARSVSASWLESFASRSDQNVI
jgi:hypothetical protein